MMVLTKFIISGTFKKKNKHSKFSKIVDSLNENTAKHYVKCKMGSDYRCPGHTIKIEKIEVYKK